MYKNITPDYYGYRDEDDGVLVAREAVREVIVPHTRHFFSSILSCYVCCVLLFLLVLDILALILSCSRSVRYDTALFLSYARRVYLPQNTYVRCSCRIDYLLHYSESRFAHFEPSFPVIQTMNLGPWIL
jgi:Isy1-like splicing family